MMRSLGLVLTCVLVMVRSEWKKTDIVFCNLSQEEYMKCMDMAEATSRDQAEDDLTFGSYYRPIRCTVPYISPEDCMKEMDLAKDEAPSVMVVDAGDVFVGGRYHSLVPILREVYENNRDYYHAVAVIKKGSLPDVYTLSDLRGKHACFAGVGTQAGWTIPLYNMLTKGFMPVSDCNNYVRSTSDFFAESCAVNTLTERYNPLGDNSNKLCELCGSADPGVRCTVKDPYAGFQGALRCLMDRGDIAFVKHNSVQKSRIDPDEFELLCLDGSRRSVTEYEECSWGTAPGHFVIVSSAMEVKERQAVQKFLSKIVTKYNHDNVIKQQPSLNSSLSAIPDYTNEVFSELLPEMPKSPFDINESIGDKYGDIADLLFSDDVKELRSIPIEEQLYRTVLKKTYGGYHISPQENINGIRRCEIPTIRLCVTSRPELDKCQRMSTALNAQLLKPRLTCLPNQPPFSHRKCMRMIYQKRADITMLEAGDIFRAGEDYGLIPIMAETYNLGTPDYYAVAVVKIRDNSSELIYLKRRNSCHTGVGQAAGWIIPMSWLISNERVRDYGCDSVRAAAEYFQKGCAPGIRDKDYMLSRIYDYNNYWHYGHMCDLCHGKAGQYCARNAMEDYYGHTGAFRCLVEGGGDVAFVKHTTVMENCDGKRNEIWSRNQLTKDYQLLCRDGTRKAATDYRDCYLGKVKANAMVTNPDYPPEFINSFINLFKYAQQFYGQRNSDEFSFSMFYSYLPYSDLIFQDAAQKLIVLPQEQRHHRTYLGREFTKAFEEVECAYVGSSGHVQVSWLVGAVIGLLTIVQVL